MTNNNELAQELEQAAVKANEHACFNMAVHTQQILSLLAERDADKKLIALNTEMFRNADRDIAALRQRIAELEARTVSVKLPKPHAHLIWIQAGHGPDDYWDDVAVSHSLKDRCCDGSERYPVYSIFEIQDACAATGIKLEVGE